MASNQYPSDHKPTMTEKVKTMAVDLKDKLTGHHDTAGTHTDAGATRSHTTVGATGTQGGVGPTGTHGGVGQIGTHGGVGPTGDRAAGTYSPALDTATTGAQPQKESMMQKIKDYLPGNHGTTATHVPAGAQINTGHGGTAQAGSTGTGYGSEPGVGEKVHNTVLPGHRNDNVSHPY